MSHATGEVIRDGKIVAWFEYNGTSDFAISHLYDTYEAMVANWRKGEQRECACGKPPVDVLLYTNYGNGYHWPAKVCLDCRAVVSSRSPYGDDGESEPTDGHPLTR